MLLLVVLFIRADCVHSQLRYLSRYPALLLPSLYHPSSFLTSDSLDSSCIDLHAHSS